MTAESEVREIANQLVECDREIARLTAALHMAMAHPDYSYCVVDPLAFDLFGGWEPNPEYQCAPGNKCLRRKNAP